MDLHDSLGGYTDLVAKAKRYDDICRTPSEHYIDLQEHLKSMSRTLKLCDSASSVDADNIAATTRSVEAAHEVLQVLILQVPLEYRPPPKEASIAQQITFAHPELLEQILSGCDNMDLLNVLQVDKGCRATIQGSVKLQRKLGLLPDPDCDVYCPLACLPLSLVIYAGPLEDSNNHAEFTSNAEISKMNTIGNKFCAEDQAYLLEPEPARSITQASSQIRKMLICQPPVKSAQVYTDCCPGDWNGNREPTPPVELLYSNDGPIAGDIFDAHARAFTKHRTCPHAAASFHDDEDFVRCGIEIEATVEVRDTDASLLSIEASVRERSQMHRKRRAKAARLAPYMWAKWDGECLVKRFVLYYADEQNS